jgi:hypothetical protein
MKKLIVLFFLILLSGIGFFVYVGHMYESQKPITPQERVDLTNNKANGLNEVYLRTKNEEILTLLKMFKEHAILALPGENTFIPQRKIGTGDFLIMMLTEGDTMSPWKGVYDFSDVFSTGPIGEGSNTQLFLVLKKKELFSDMTNGVLFAHELDHIRFYLHLNKSKKPLDKDSLCREEVRAHTFSDKLFSQIGGQEYQKIVDVRAKEYADYFLSVDGKISPPSQYSSKLNKIFGPPLSSGETKRWLTAFEITSVFQAIDNYYPGIDKDTEKARLYCEMDPSANSRISRK